MCNFIQINTPHFKVITLRIIGDEVVVTNEHNLSIEEVCKTLGIKTKIIKVDDESHFKRQYLVLYDVSVKDKDLDPINAVLLKLISNPELSSSSSSSSISIESISSSTESESSSESLSTESLSTESESSSISTESLSTESESSSISIESTSSESSSISIESTSSESSSISLIASPPIFTSMDPANGAYNAETPVTITGANFLAATGVTFGGVAALDFAVVDDTSITCTVPKNFTTIGGVDVVVTSPAGSSTEGVSAWYYDTVVPTYSSIDYTQQPYNEETPVTIYGAGFTYATDVVVSTVIELSVRDFVVVDDATITCTFPSLLEFAPPPYVSNPSTDILSPYFKIIYPEGFSDLVYPGVFWGIPLPIVTSINPTSGPYNTNDEAVTITGSHLLFVQYNENIRFWDHGGSDAATDVVVVDDSTVTCKVPFPFLMVVGLQDVVATNPTGSGTLVGGYTRAITTATIYGVYTVEGPTTPATGPAMTATPIFITGIGFVYATGVLVGGQSVSFVVVDDFRIDCDTPADIEASVVDVVVQHPEGNVTAVGGFTFT